MAAVGSITITDQNVRDKATRPVRKVTLAWTSSAGGAVSGNPTDYISGELVRVVFVPGTAGAQPTNAYDVTLVISGGDGIDLLAGQGSNLANNANTHVKPGVPMKDGTTTTTAGICVDDKLELVVANAGDTKSGQVILYIR